MRAQIYLQEKQNRRKWPQWRSVCLAFTSKAFPLMSFSSAPVVLVSVVSCGIEKLPYDETGIRRARIKAQRAGRSGREPKTVQDAVASSWTSAKGFLGSFVRHAKSDVACCRSAIKRSILPSCSSSAWSICVRLIITTSKVTSALSPNIVTDLLTKRLTRKEPGIYQFRPMKACQDSL